MNRVEMLLCNRVFGLGINPESKGIKGYSIAFFETFARIDQFVHHTVYEGDELPIAGATIFTANHTGFWNAAQGYRKGQMSGRIIRTFVRETLLDPNAKEPEAIKKRTGNKSDFLNSAPHLLLRFLALFPKGVEAASAPRGGGLPELRRILVAGSTIIQAGQIAAMFINETRIEDGDLRDPMPGVELLAADNPDTPIYAARIKPGQRSCLKVIEPTRFKTKRLGTYNELCANDEYGELARTSLTILLMDQIADQFDDEARDGWYEIRDPELRKQKALKRILTRLH